MAQLRNQQTWDYQERITICGSYPNGSVPPQLFVLIETCSHHEKYIY